MTGPDEEVPKELREAVDGIFAPSPPPPPEPQQPPEMPENLSDEALAELDEWVRGTLMPTYGREVDTTYMWCTRWWEHPEAVARLWALYLAWAELHNPESTDAATGPIVWQKDYLDYTLDRLRDPSGPFGGCMSRPGRPDSLPQHTVQLVPACEPWPGPHATIGSEEARP